MEWDRRAIERQGKPIEKSGFGDKIESALTLLGITKEKVEKWIGRPCGCKERKEKLNKLGRWAAKVMRLKGKANE